MKVLSAIGGFFARIGRWIKETAWIQPLLIVGAIFAVIFASPHIIDGVKGWFDESDAANKYFAKYQLSLDKANDIPEGKFVGDSEVDKLFTLLEDNNEAEIKSQYGEKFFVAFVEKENSTCKDLYGGFKMLEDKWSSKNAEFASVSGDTFKLYTIYTDTVDEADESINYFDVVWSNHYELFEDLSRSDYLENTFYAKNKNYKTDNYLSAFVGGSDAKTCPMTSPLVMYFDYTNANNVPNQRIKGLSDVLFSVDGSSDLEKARTLRDCWSHSDIFGKIKDN